MESGVNEVQSSPLQENQKDDENTTTENFQGFIYDFFEKNGILNDLRAHLRGHIVTVLRTARTGEVPACQKQFTQRLELQNQALNMLIAEYLVRLEFSYTLSVFVSEIPLANMVFGFAQSLLRHSPDKALTEIFFSEDDVCSLLNHLGIRMDSENASHILQMYRTEHKPLLVCIFKCMPLYMEPHIKPDNHSDCIESSSQTSDISSYRNKHSYKNHSTHHAKCKHHKSCKACQNKFEKLKAAFKEKKQSMAEMRKQKAVNVSYNGMFMKNISVMERTLIDEMIKQLQTVYEEEIEMLKREEQKITRRSKESCLSQLEKKRDEMESAFKEKEDELEHNIQQKKKFLWGLARSLRDQHAHLSRAMRAVKDEQKRLTDKERMLKTQLTEAQETLKKRGEEMKTLISNEIEILVVHLKAMKEEKDKLNREKQEFEALKRSFENDKDLKLKNFDDHNTSPTRFEIIENELSAVKKCMETIKSQVFVAETSTYKELIAVCLNNEQERIAVDDRPSSHRVNPNQVVNDFKKQKNVNLSAAEEIRRSRSRSRSPTNIEPATLTADGQTQQLMEENERLKIFARQQQEHIEKLTSLQTRLQAELTTAQCRIDNLILNRQQPQPEPFYVTMQRAGACTPPFRLAGRGEEVMAYSAATPRVIIPGDDVPFLGVIEGHTAGKRHLIRQWRALRKTTPPRGVSKAPRPMTSHRECFTRVDADDKQHATTPGSSNMAQEARERSSSNNLSETQRANTETANTEMRGKKDKSPASKEPAEKSNKKNKMSDIQSNIQTEKSPEAIVKEARRQLRKLEIEAEAVEQSYLKFRKGQTERQVEKAKHQEPLSSTSKPVAESTGERRGAKRSKVSCVFGNWDSVPNNILLLEKPLTEFRKLYRSRNSKRYSQNAAQIVTIELACENEINEVSNKLAEDKERDISEVKEIGIIKQNPETAKHTMKAKLNEIQDGIKTENQEIKVIPENNIHNLSESETEYINNYLNAPTGSTKYDFKADNKAKKDMNVRNIISEQSNNKTYKLEEPINNLLIAPTLSTKDNFKPVNEVKKDVNVHSEISKESKTLELEEEINNFLNAPTLSIKDNFKPIDEVKEDVNVHSEISKKSKGLELEELMNNLNTPALSTNQSFEADNEDINLQSETSEQNINKTRTLEESVENIPILPSNSNNFERTQDHLIIETCVEQEQKNNLLIFVESSEATQISETEINGKKKFTEITVIITPKINKTVSEDVKSSEAHDTSEVEDNLIKNEVLEAMFSENHNLISNAEVEKDLDKNGSDEYGDDFSADIDVSSKIDISNDSISVHKSENDNDDFWD